MLQYVRTLEHIEPTPKSRNGPSTIAVWMLEPDSPHGKVERGFAKDEALKLLKMKVVRLGADKVTVHQHVHRRESRNLHIIFFTSATPAVLACSHEHTVCAAWPIGCGQV